MSALRHSEVRGPRLLPAKPTTPPSLPRLGCKASCLTRQRRVRGIERLPRWAIGKRRIASPNSHPETEALMRISFLSFQALALMVAVAVCGPAAAQSLPAANPNTVQANAGTVGIISGGV